MEEGRRGGRTPNAVLLVDIKGFAIVLSRAMTMAWCSFNICVHVIKNGRNRWLFVWAEQFHSVNPHPNASQGISQNESVYYNIKEDNRN